MQISKIRISGYKGVDVELPWASAMVLFGANDSGKTNILEAFLSQFGSDRSVRGEGTHAHLELSICLNGIDTPGHQDQVTFLGWVLGDNMLRQWYVGWSRYVSGGFKESADDLDHSWDELEQFWRESQKRDEGTEWIDRLTAEVRSLVSACWDLRVAAGEIPVPSALPQAGEVAASSCDFRITPSSIEWTAADGTSMFSCVQAAEARIGRESYLDILGMRVIRIEPTADSIKSIQDRLEREIQDLAFRFDSLDADEEPEDGQEEDRDPCLGPTPWLDRVKRPWVKRRQGVTSLRLSVQGACDALGAYASSLAPPFVSASYDIHVVPLHPDEWERHGGRHLIVRLQAHGGRERFDLDNASSGIAAWTRFALSEALRLVEAGAADMDLPRRPTMDDMFTTDFGDGPEPMSKSLEPFGMDLTAWQKPLFGKAEVGLPSGAPEPPTIYVFDEPETHLHPLAQRQAADWIAERTRAGAHVLLASHALPFLDLDLEDVEYLAVARNAEWKTAAQAITNDIFSAVAGSAAALGLPPTALIQLTRGWLMIEGEHDRRIVDAFFGPELRRAGVQVLPLRGAARAKASFVAVEALKPLGLPFFCLLDNTFAMPSDGKTSSKPKTQEEFIAEQLQRLAVEEGVDLTMVTWPYPDIICALPIEAVRRLASESKGRPEAATSWHDLIEGHGGQRREAKESGEKPPDFKTHVLNTLGLTGRSPDWFVDEVLRLCEQRPPDGCPLVPVVAGVIARIDSRRDTSADAG